MKNFEFKSQICTTKEQSERLLALGLKKETADMMYITDVNVPEEYRHYDLAPEYYEPCMEGIVHIPAWSLHRLLELATTKRKVLLIRIGVDLYDTIIEKIRRMIVDGVFNKDYLEEKY